MFLGNSQHTTCVHVCMLCFRSILSIKDSSSKLFYIEKFQGFLGVDSITGKMIQVSLESTQLEVGIRRSLFTLPYNEISFLPTHCWIKHLWQLVDKNNILIKDYYTALPSPKQHNDLFLMEVLHNEGYKKSKIKINRCRLHLQI